MSGDKYEKPSATAPPPFTSTYPVGGGDDINQPPAYGFQPPPPQYSQYPQHPQPQYVPPPVMTQPTPVTNQQTVLMMGGCPTCRVGVLQDSYTCCGICCAICFFPIGILCCLCMKEKKCTSCKATF